MSADEQLLHPDEKLTHVTIIVGVDVRLELTEDQVKTLDAQELKERAMRIVNPEGNAGYRDGVRYSVMPGSTYIGLRAGPY